MRMGPCMCGDPYCWSCGPAQGNYKCPVCGKWSADGGCTDPERCDKEMKRMDEEMMKAEEEWIGNMKENNK